jgi:hypothetical protein
VADIDIRPVRPGDVEALVVKMRHADVEELRAIGITDLVPEIQGSVDRSLIARTGTADGEVGCIFGVVPAQLTFDPWGMPWMLGTDLVTKHQRVLMRRCRPYIQDMLRLYPHLFNYVHAENHAAIRWLKCVGFSLQSPAPYGPEGALFHRFDMRA